MSNYEVLLPGFSSKGPNGYAVQIETAKDNKYIKFDAGEVFSRSLTDPLKVTYTATVGDMNRRHLHERLDQWIDANLEKNA
jgi:hypothetical protein